MSERKYILIECEIDQPFRDAEQEQCFLASLESALTLDVWFDILCNPEVAPQQASKVAAHFLKRRPSL